MSFTMPSPSSVLHDSYVVTMLERVLTSGHFTPNGKILACEVICACSRAHGWLITNPAWEPSFLKVMEKRGYIDIHPNGGIGLTLIDQG